MLKATQKNEFQKLLQGYNLGRILTIKQFPKGQQNWSYHLKTTRGDFTLKIYRWKQRKEIEFEIRLLNLLKGLPIPKIIKGKNYIGTWQRKYFVLFKYIKGRQLSNLSSRQLKSLGSFIGRFHNRSQGFKSLKKRTGIYQLPPSRIKSIIKKVRSSRIPYQKNLFFIRKRLLTNQLPSSLPQGGIHADIKPENIIFRKGKLCGVIDFDNSFIGPLLSDLTRSIVWSCSDFRKGRLNYQKAKMVFDAYTKTRKLTKQEKENLFKAFHFSFASHIFMDYFEYIAKVTTKKYFEFIVKQFYPVYRNFTITRKELERCFFN